VKELYGRTLSHFVEDISFRKKGYRKFSVIQSWRRGRFGVNMVAFLEFFGKFHRRTLTPNLNLKKKCFLSLQVCKTN
jgi:hypothetical protein